LPSEPTPMDVAKAELAYSIDKLRPDKAPADKPKGRSTRRDPEARHFAIITYSTEVTMFTEGGWVEATDASCNSWMTAVDKLETESTTNIHGALVMGFGLSDARLETPEPEVDKDCVLTGAHTIVFLTDGYATWSNDSRTSTAKDEFGNPCGDGEYVKRDKLIELAATLNRFRKVVINTVGIGNHDKKLMGQLAKQSGGHYEDWYCRIVTKKLRSTGRNSFLEALGDLICARGNHVGLFGGNARGGPPCFKHRANLGVGPRQTAQASINVIG
jgi:hypothetical protein